MVNTWNTAELNEKVNNLNAKVDKINVLPDASEATTGQILKLTGEDKTPEWSDESGYTPPAYSTTETAIGQKWIDGRDIYAKTYTGSITTNYQTIDADFNGQNEIIKADAYVLTDAGGMSNGYISTSWCCAVSYNTSQFLNIYTGNGLSGGTYKVTVYYVKPLEPEEAKTTKKKTTK